VLVAALVLVPMQAICLLVALVERFHMLLVVLVVLRQ
jgi:hypothetical protein